MRRYLLLLSVVFLAGCSHNYSQGYRVGTLRKLSHKGFLIKSWEGELLLGGVTSTGGKNPQLINETWDFSIDPESLHGEDNDLIVGDIAMAANRGCRVKLFYNQDTFLKIRTETDYLVYKCELEKDDK